MVWDLGGRSVPIIPLVDHTGNDLVIIDEESQVTFAGDWIWPTFAAVFTNWR